MHFSTFPRIYFLVIHICFSMVFSFLDQNLENACVCVCNACMMGAHVLRKCIEEQKPWRNIRPKMNVSKDFFGWLPPNRRYSTSAFHSVFFFILFCCYAHTIRGSIRMLSHLIAAISVTQIRANANIHACCIDREGTSCSLSVFHQRDNLTRMSNG